MLSRHGTYRRWIYLADRREKIVIFRLRCRPCRLTVALLPDVVAPYVRYALEITEAALSGVLEGTSCRASAVKVSRAELPTDASVTDALTWTPTTPSYQRVHSWLARLLATAAADVLAAAEWLVRRKPAGLGVHLVTSPLEPNPRGPVRAALEAGRLLLRLFSHDPDLNPAGLGWLRAWRRFEGLVFRRPPWRRPFRAPPEPQSS